MLEAGKEPVVESSIVKDLGTVWERELPAKVRNLAAFIEPVPGNQPPLAKRLAFATKVAPKLTIKAATVRVQPIARGLGLR